MQGLHGERHTEYMHGVPEIRVLSLRQRQGLGQTRLHRLRQLRSQPIGAVRQENKMLRSGNITLGANKGAPRVYLEGRWLAAAGFQPSSLYSVQFGNGKVVIELDPAGQRKVSAKRDMPVIDINSAALGGALNNAQKLEVRAFNQRIEISPAYTLILVAGRQLVAGEGSLFSGGGFLSEAARLNGFQPKFAVEIDSDYAAIYERNHPGAVMFNMSAHEVPWDSLRNFRPLGLLTAGIPCEPYSVIRTLNRGGQQKRDKSLPPEAHELGDMTFWLLRAVEAANPYGVIIEEVPGYLESASGYVLQNVLRRLGYHVEARVLDPTDFGELTGRRRTVVVASSASVRWPNIHVPSNTQHVRRIGDILDVEPHEWFDRSTKPWLYEHWDKQAAKGNGFPSQIVSSQSTQVGTIKKRYFAQQGDNPVIAHPTKPNTHRWFTINEVKRLHGIPDDYYVGDAKTTAGEVMGQGVHVGLFEQIIRANFQLP